MDQVLGLPVDVQPALPVREERTATGRRKGQGRPAGAKTMFHHVDGKKVPVKATVKVIDRVYGGVTVKVLRPVTYVRPYAVRTVTVGSERFHHVNTSTDDITQVDADYPSTTVRSIAPVTYLRPTQRPSWLNVDAQTRIRVIR